MGFDRVSRFLDISQTWEMEGFEKPGAHSLAQFIGDPKDCVIFNRACDVEDMETESDEQYVFCTADRGVRSQFNRFETRAVIARLHKSFDSEKVEHLIKMAWNYPKMVINRKTGQFEPFADPALTSIPNMTLTSYPPKKTVYIED